MNVRTALAATATAGLLGSALLLAPSALAQGGGPSVTTSGHCSASATWKLKVKADNGVLQSEAEIDSNVNRQVWAWTLRDNGALKASGHSTTVAPSGSFTVKRNIANLAGTDHVVFRATHGTQTCVASANL